MWGKLLLTLAVVFGIFLALTWIRKRRTMWSPIRNSEYAELLPYIQAQAKHESANFTSALATNHNNIFGMTVPTIRKSTRIGEVYSQAEMQYFSKFKTKRDAVEDFLLWLRNANFPKKVKSAEEYVQRMQLKGYFTDTIINYLNGIKRWLGKLI